MDETSDATRRVLDYANTLPNVDAMNWNRAVEDAIAELRKSALGRDRLKLLNAVRQILLECADNSKPKKDPNTLLVCCAYILSEVEGTHWNQDELVARLIDFMGPPKSNVNRE